MRERVVILPRFGGIDPPDTTLSWRDGTWSRFEGGFASQSERPAGSNGNSDVQEQSRGRPGTSLGGRSILNWTSKDSGKRADLKSHLRGRDLRPVWDSSLLAVHPSNIAKSAPRKAREPTGSRRLRLTQGGWIQTALKRP